MVGREDRVQGRLVLAPPRGLGGAADHVSVVAMRGYSEVIGGAITLILLSVPHIKAVHGHEEARSHNTES